MGIYDRMYFFFKTHIYIVRTEGEIQLLVQIGELIKTKRLSLSMSRSKLALDLGVDEKQLRRIENGETNPSIISIMKIFVLLDLDFSILKEFTLGNDFISY